MKMGPVSSRWSRLFIAPAATAAIGALQTELTRRSAGYGAVGNASGSTTARRSRERWTRSPPTAAARS